MADEPEQRVVTLMPGETYELSLPSLGTAGYVWAHAVDDDAGAVEVSRRRGAPEREPRIAGRSTSEQVLVAARAPGRAVVRLTQARPWEQGAPRATIVLTVEVRLPESHPPKETPRNDSDFGEI